MNRFHRWYCRSDRWAGKARSQLVPWALGDVALGDDVLEIGPGPGITTALIRPRAAARMTVLEIDPWSVAALRARFDADGGVTVVEGDAAEMPFEADRFSAVVCLTMFHHVPSVSLQDSLLREAFRVLGPGGTFLGSDSTMSLRFRLYHLGDTCVPVDPDEFVSRLRRAGFADPRITKVRRSFRFRAVKG
ncbi:MAG: class I SAM-dependent methyltransferase [Actinomycetota bacterium]